MNNIIFGWDSLVRMKWLIFFLSIISYCTSAQQHKNVLFFAIDDLRPELGAYGHDFIKSPHIDDLASKSILFERAYCQVAVCSPSRTSLLTGRRADSNHVWRIAGDEYWRTVPDATNATTIPQYFKENGYLTIGMGKIFHPGAPNGNDDVKYSWNQEWKKGAFSQFPRPYSGMVKIPGHPPFDHNQHDENVMGYTIRTDKYRFTEWYTFDRDTSKPDFDKKWGTELYDHSTPTVSFNDENINIADKPEMESTVTELRKALQDGWRAALPPTI
ncbi:PREDICTED: N-acetylgalactosamine-6-sulfatase-like [Amphimedon queenslandica]|uniref:Sulfatase N-terminal domain-containing protein n=1 Tax=Amphimedon queenslandica TaxID=400682 RepID=A0AAN0J0T8_AMPQE|nr:PREDICTED: N-acetylgalactosamine-6-sulfatase-like [Amphimedon queenslandica]|eukprot:XP_019850331.1 PREDICTED: N-acetylgalactosamine-6-sulfatase-like [Amphimedon queenslandica]